MYRMWMVVRVLGGFYRILIWQGTPEDFVLEDGINPYGLLEFELFVFETGGGWNKTAVPDWAIDQVYDKTVKAR